MAWLSLNSTMRGQARACHLKDTANVTCAHWGKWALFLQSFMCAAFYYDFVLFVPKILTCIKCGTADGMFSQSYWLILHINLVKSAFVKEEAKQDNLLLLSRPTQFYTTVSSASLQLLRAHIGTKDKINHAWPPCGNLLYDSLFNLNHRVVWQSFF